MTSVDKREKTLLRDSVSILHMYNLSLGIKLLKRFSLLWRIPVLMPVIKNTLHHVLSCKVPISTTALSKHFDEVGVLRGVLR